MEKISVAFVDDHPVLLTGLEALFRSEDKFDVKAVGCCAGDALEIAKSHEPNVIVMDLNMPGKVLETISRIAARYKGTKVLAFTASTSVENAIAALEAGCRGFVLKGSSQDDLSEAIHKVHANDTYITPGFSNKVIDGLRTAALRRATVQSCRLSTREEQVVSLLLRGKTNKEIADKLSISDKTVKHYMTVLMQKMNVRNRIEVVLAAQEMGIGKPGGLRSAHV